MRLIILLLVVCLFEVPQLSAHEAHGSSATVTLQGNKLEVLQTMPLSTTQSIAKSLTKPLTTSEELSNNEMITAIAKGWEVSSGKENCQLQKQAYRLVHAYSELQMRYLFTCESGASPQKLALPWLMHAPEDHFITMTMVREDKSKTVIFQRQALIINLLE